MGMPRQLARGLRTNHLRRKSPPPVIELMPSISINELRRVIPTHHGTYTQPDVSLKYPQIGRLRLTIDSIEIVDRFGRKQVFRIRWARTYFGRPRPIIECTCRRGQSSYSINTAPMPAASAMALSIRHSGKTARAVSAF